MRVDVWSDVVCPWCYIGFVRLNKVLDQFDEECEVYYHAFQLDKNAENTGKLSVQHLAEKFGIHVDDAKAMMGQVSEIARSENLHYKLEETIHGNTRLAHRLLHLAAESGVQKALLSRLFHAYFEEAKPIFTSTQLQPYAHEMGISDEDFQLLLTQNAYDDVVEFDQQLAHDIQIQGVPFFVFNQSVAVAGAESEEVLNAALLKARESAGLDTSME